MSDRSYACRDDASSILSDATMLAGTALASLQLLAVPFSNGVRGDEGSDVDFGGYHEQCLSMLIDLIAKISRASKKVQEEQYEYDKALSKYKRTVEMLRKLRDENTGLRKKIEDFGEKSRRDNHESIRKVASMELILKKSTTELESLKSAAHEYVNEREVRSHCRTRFFDSLLLNNRMFNVK